MWSKAQWEDRIRSRLADLGTLSRIAPERIPFALEAALAIYSNDNPRTTVETFPGDGSTYDFALDATAFELGWSRVTLVEYPTGERDPSYLEDGYDWIRLEDTRTVRFLNDTPATGESVAITYLTRWPYPTDTAGDDPIPEVHAHAVAALAAAEAADAEAAARARQQDASVMTTLVATDSEALRTAARSARKLYTDTVLGRPSSAEAPPTVAYAESNVDVFPSTIFHRRTRL